MKSNKQDKYRSIIEAAKSLFNQTHDVRRVSLEAIAAEAGVSPTTIYNRFGDRETLVFEVIKDLVSQTLERNRALVHSDLPFPQKIIGIMSSKLNMAEKVNREIIEKLVSQDKKIAPFIDEIYAREIKPLWQAIMADGKKEGYVDPTLDDETLLAYLDIIQAGLKAKPEVFVHFKENMGFIEQLTRLMFYGFLKKEIDIFPGKNEVKRHV
ncbi:MAG: TetR/AcrR family transcriptional regulator [Dehalococcoidales bacterium]|nr:TetR/AcrR family transcriptional regulator [Dehalococcoidales bacterium]